MVSTEKKAKKLYMGQVVSDAMDKTITVKTERTFTDPVFGKVRRICKKYKVHDEQEKSSVGDVVEFYETRPLSKTKYMMLNRIVKTANARAQE
jgi:small subunit ribosomal protein S17